MFRLIAKSIKTFFSIFFCFFILLIIISIIATGVSYFRNATREKPVIAIGHADTSYNLAGEAYSFKNVKTDIDDHALMRKCIKYAKLMGYNSSKINEVYFTKRLPEKYLGYSFVFPDGYSVILINKKAWFMDDTEIARRAMDETIVHEIIHVFTDSKEEWHAEMKRAATLFPELSKSLLEDERTDHPLK